MGAVSGIQAAAGSVASSKALAAVAVAAAATVGAGIALTVAIIVTMSGAAGSMCSADGTDGGDGGGGSSPGSPDSGGYVSQEPSEEALADIPGDYLESYREAGEEYGLDWTIVAGIGKVESDHGRYSEGCEQGPPTPYGAATGPMQFLDSTWETQGVDGNDDGVADPCDPEDAIPAAAGYLRDSGAPDDYYSAIYAYNHADWYVQEVMGFADDYRQAEEESGQVALLLAPTQAASTGLDAFVSRTGQLASRPLDAVGPVNIRSAEAEAQGWDLVDSNQRLDYENHSSYTSAVDHAASVWDDLGSVPVEESSGSGTDVQVGDAYLQSGIAGLTSTDGTLYLNPEQMDGATTNAQNAVATHEFGHAVGIGHTSVDSVMNAPIIRNSSANNEVPTAYDREVYYGNWGQPSNENVSNGDPLGDGGGGEGSIEGNTSAVFPLPSEYMDSYEDTWGAARGHGGHEGTDMFAPEGTEIFSITAGTVVSASGSDSEGWNELGGWTTMVEASESVGPVQAGDMLYYAHQEEPSPVAVGQTVEAGDVIGHVGSTGEGPPGTLLQPASRGQHLHLGWYDPSGARAEAASGAMNPYPLLEWLRESGGTASGGDPGDSGGSSVPGWCPPGTGDGPGGEGGQIDGTEPVDPGSGDASELLQNPNFTANDGAVADLESGQVDRRLVGALQAIAQEHEIYISAMKSDHPMGPYIDGGYGSAGGAENTHYFYRAADIAQVDGMPVESNGTGEAVLDVGRILAGIAPSERPDEIIGPPEWQAELAYPREAGFITDGSLNSLHSDHLHVGLSSEGGTSNTQ